MGSAKNSIALIAAVFLCMIWTSAAQAQDGDDGVATVVERELPAEYRHAGETGWAEVPDGGSIKLGDSLRTGAGGRLKLIFNDKSILILSENTTLDVTEHVYDPAKKQRKSLFKLYEGKVRAIVGELFGAASRFEVETPVAVAGVKGTDFDTHHQDPCSTVYTHAGSVKAENSDSEVEGEVKVPDGYLTIVCEGEPPTEPIVAPDDFIAKTVPLRGDGTTSPEPPPEDGDAPGPSGPDTTPPNFPGDVRPAPTDLGGLPTTPPVFPPPPSPIVNNTLP